MARGLVCRPCMRFFRVVKVGVYVEEGMRVTGPDGTAGWGPYKLWVADLHRCEGCGHELLAGFGMGPVAEHYEPGYAETVERLGSIGRVDDCGGSRP